MKKLSLFSVILLLASSVFSQTATPQPVIGARVVNVLQVSGLLFKDLNKNGKLDKYEDWRLPLDERVNDLVAQMTIEEKTGLMVGPQLSAGPNGSVSEQAVYGTNPFNPGPIQLNSPATSDALLRRNIRQFINRENLPARTMATWLNAVQQIAEGSRLGIPVIFVTNPRNQYGTQNVFGIQEAGSAFSQWPGPLGLAATRDIALIEEFARIAAQEYVAVGLRGGHSARVAAGEARARLIEIEAAVTERGVHPEAEIAERALGASCPRGASWALGASWVCGSGRLAATGFGSFELTDFGASSSVRGLLSSALRKLETAAKESENKEVRWNARQLIKKIKARGGNRAQSRGASRPRRRSHAAAAKRTYR